MSKTRPGKETTGSVLNRQTLNMAGEYIDPDVIYAFANWLDASRGDIRDYPMQAIGMPRKEVGATFIYAGDGKLAVGPVVDTHFSLIRKYGQQLYGQSFGLSDAERFRKQEAEGSSLIGRTGLALPGYSEDRIRRLQMKYSLAAVWPRVKDKVLYVISFWNDNAELYEQLLSGCLEALGRAVKVPPTAYISTPFDGTTEASLANIGTRRGPTQLDPATAERLRKQRELHLMRPGEKRAAMQDLGLAAPKGPHPWQQAPGQKWWAATSEDVDAIAGMITDDPDVFAD